ncbi:unnamed protein product, partial [marine sediment metagenome]
MRHAVNQSGGRDSNDNSDPLPYALPLEREWAIE